MAMIEAEAPLDRVAAMRRLTRAYIEADDVRASLRRLTVDDDPYVREQIAVAVAMLAGAVYALVHASDRLRASVEEER